jgi:hypothetical protein
MAHNICCIKCSEVVMSSNLSLGGVLTTIVYPPIVGDQMTSSLSGSLRIS